jgi:3-dehydroquinate synthase
MTAPLKHSDSVTVDVALGTRAYDIVIGRGVLQSLGQRVAGLRPGARTAIVTDRTVARYWLDKTEASLAEAGIATSRIIVEEGEASKTYAGLEKVSEALIAARIERNDLVVALGGGVVGAAASISCRCRPRCWRRSIPRSAARPGSIRRRAKTCSAPFTSRCW